MDQIAASWEESERGGDLAGGKLWNFQHSLLIFVDFPVHVDIVPNVGFWRSWCPRKACDTLFLKVSDLRRAKLGSGRYDLANGGCQRVFPCRGVIFRLRFRLDRRSSWRSESCVLELKLPSSLKFPTCGPNCCGSERIYAQTPPPK